MIDILPHFSVENFSNSYLIGNQETKEAVIVDPGHFDIGLLKMIEDNEYELKSVLVTHSHSTHSEGIITMKKIYDIDIFSGNDSIEGTECTRVFDKQVFESAGLTINPVSMAGHSRDSFVFVIDNFIFTGDSIEAGRLGSTASEFLAAQLKDNIKNKLLSLKENYIIFPGHGPVTTLELEKMFNYAI